MNGVVSKAQVYRCLKPRTSTQKANEFSSEDTVKPVIVDALDPERLPACSSP